MITVTLQTRKGGSGKTTLACSLAVAATSDGVRTVILDADPQRTADAWISSRSADVPDLMCVASPAEIPAAVEAARQSYGLVLVDTPRGGIRLQCRVARFGLLPHSLPAYRARPACRHPDGGSSALGGPSGCVRANTGAVPRTQASSRRLPRPCRPTPLSRHAA